MDHCKHDLAGNGTIEAEPDRKADRGGDRDQHEVVADIVQPGELEIAEQLVWLCRIDRIDAPDQLGHVLEDQEDGVGHEQQHDLVAAIEHLQEAALEQQADGGGDQRHREQHRDKAEARRQAVRGDQRHHGCRNIGAERVKAAMGDVEDFQHAEYQREPQRHDKQPRSLNQAVEDDGQEKVHGREFRREVADSKQRRERMGPCRCMLALSSCRRRSIAFGALHAALDPVQRLDARRRIDALGGKILDVDQIDPLQVGIVFGAGEAD